MGGKRQSVTPGHLLDEGSNTGKRVRDTSRCIFSLYSGSRASNAEAMEKIALPLPPKEREDEVDVPRKLFPRLGVG